MPSKTIEDFAYQVRDYMRGAEVVEGKNKLKVTATSTSASGITITYNYDSNGNLLDITFGTGTVTGGNIDLQIGDITDLTNGNDYVVSGCPSGGSTSPSTYFIWLRNSNSQSISGAPADTGDGATFTKTSEYAKVGIRIQNGFVISTPLVFKPMICTKAEWTRSHTYEPYYVPVKDRYSNYYSTTAPIDTGKIWIDGKKIYRKVIDTTFSADSNAKYVNIGDIIDTVVDYSAMMQVSGFFMKLASMTTNAGLPTNAAKVSVTNKNDGNPNCIVLLNNATNWYSNPVIVTVEYTKG